MQPRSEVYQPGLRVPRNLLQLCGFIVRLGASQHARHIMSTLSPGNAIFIAGIIGLSFLAEVTVFAMLGIF
jgi:hypothetical protein